MTAAIAHRNAHVAVSAVSLLEVGALVKVLARCTQALGEGSVIWRGRIEIS